MESDPWTKVALRRKKFGIAWCNGTDHKSFSLIIQQMVITILNFSNHLNSSKISFGFFFHFDLQKHTLVFLNDENCINIFRFPAFVCFLSHLDWVEWTKLIKLRFVCISVRWIRLVAVLRSICIYLWFANFRFVVLFVRIPDFLDFSILFFFFGFTYAFESIFCSFWNFAI